MLPRLHMPRLISLCALVLLVAGVRPAASSETLTVERERYLMGTRFTVLLQGEDRAALESAASAAFDAVARYEDVTSNWRADSELSKLHAAIDAQGAGRPRPVAVSGDLYDVLAAARSWCQRSEGAFDATVEPLTRAYDLRGAGRMPGEADLAAARARVQGRDVVLDPAARTVHGARAGIAFDLAGIAKGAAIDRAVGILRARGVTRALLNFGGQLYGLGAPIGGAAWTVDLADPRDRARPLATVSLRDRSVSTTASSERSLRVGDTTINHVLDPRTGRPSPAWGAAVVLAARAIDADAASTALYVLGPVEGAAWASRQADLEALLLVEDAAIAGGLRIERVAPSVAMMAAAQGPGGTPDNAELARRIEVLAGEVEDMKLGEVAAPAGTPRFGLGPAASKV
ncbi:MAG: FAD:protein FMN transferase, partial [Candidatus Eisenbacteria bacterium]